MITTRLFILISLLTVATASFSQVNVEASTAFLKRIIPGRESGFLIEEIPDENGKDVFELESRNGKVVLRGNNGLSVASALNYYLKNYCHADIGWNGTNLKVPAKLPAVKEKVHKATPYQYRYYLNYCTFQYSMAWWDWQRWEKEIDWMALNGINMPLSLTGEEAIWQEVYRSMGFTDKELANFFTGPAYFSWLWMGNIDAWGGPLPQHWIDSHKELQLKIVQREREFGMKPVLPAFTGHVPPSFKDKFPGAKVKKTNWDAGFPDVYILDPEDPLFDSIGVNFIKAQTRIYGTDHLYSSDTFNENVPPTNDSTYLSAMSKKVYESMSKADPQAVWVMQGWMFSYNNKFWQPQQIQALLNAVPEDKMIVLDLWSETHPIWNKSNAYYGKPWIWNMLHNFGGNVSMFGRMKHVAEDPSAALNSSSSGKMVGIGLTPEGIEQNPALYQLMLQNVWQKEPVDLDEWLKNYAFRRYGKENAAINEAWQILKNTVYNGGPSEGGPESIIVARPTFDPSPARVLTKLDYQPSELIKAWDKFVSSSSALGTSEGFQYDMVDLSRQVLANYASVYHAKFSEAYKRGDQENFKLYSSKFLGLLDDMDKLLATRKDFLLGKWIAEARACGITKEEQDIYEFNARDLITLWGDKDSPLREYSNRQWSGLIRAFYKPRWASFFKYLDECLTRKKQADVDAFQEEIKNWEWKWVNSHEGYSSKPSGDPVGVSKALYQKYRNEMVKAYN